MSDTMRQPSFSPVPAEDSSRKRLSLGLVAVAVASSVIASTCCVIPLVLVLLGITGAWMVNLTALRPLTPVFVGVALLALAWAGYLVFRPAAQCSYPDGAACDRTRRITKRIYLASAVFIGLLLLFPVIAPIFY
ncbi:mercuric transporter MerT family protein [Noviherbaspirillum massiliense]|uniref:mercuric transporter MerT family protein n=1 Tax=Noviherbaspirillum massiliense TaxID=1465823 RepID=UPI0003754D0E|nr:mercuric transporter MerT family protein [Noviherbaspirillum massiliense]